jgi:hypothetical protein
MVTARALTLATLIAVVPRLALADEARDLQGPADPSRQMQALSRTAGEGRGEGDRLTLVAAPCVAALVDPALLVAALRVELRARGVVDVALATDGSTPPGRVLHVDCRDGVLVAAGDGAPIDLPLLDVATETRPRVVGLALAELLAMPVGEPPPASIEPTPAARLAAPPSAPRTGPRLVRTARVARALTGWSLAAKLEGLTVPPSVFAAGAEVGLALWGDHVGARVASGIWGGAAAGSPFRIADLSLALGVAGPRLGAGRLDLEVALLGGLVWAKPGSDTDVESGLQMNAFWGFGADLVMRWPLAERWTLAANLGYRRIASGDAADLAALGISVARAL